MVSEGICPISPVTGESEKDMGCLPIFIEAVYIVNIIYNMIYNL